jgi:plasmid stabilization system protein ParE
MTRQLIIREQGEQDITQAALWYENQSAGLAESFLAEIDIALANALKNPRQFPCFRRKPEVRRVLLTRFPYRLFFVLRRDAIIVFRILHAARHDREWKRNIPKN